MRPPHRSLHRCAVAAALAAVTGIAAASEFSVTPIRAELKPGAMNETITVTNHADTRLRVSVKLLEWTQDAQGKDIYKESADLVYFPRQMEVEPNGKRLVRVGAKAPATGTEKTYRLFIEEEPEAAPTGGPAAVNFYFRFGVPVFLPPPAAKPQPEVGEPKLEKGRLSLVVGNPGNQHFRLVKLVVTDGASYTQEVAGWYSLAGTTRTYSAQIPPDACRRVRSLTVRGEGEVVNFERKLAVDPSSCS